jgi:hypothetical protein
VICTRLKCFSIIPTTLAYAVSQRTACRLHRRRRQIDDFPRDFTPIRSNTVAKLTSQQFRAKHWRLCYPPPPIRRLRGIVCYFACRRSLSDLISVHYRQSAFFIFTCSGWESTWLRRRYQTQQFLIDDAEKRMRIRHFANPCLIGGISGRAISDVFDPRDNPQTRVAQYISHLTEYRNNSRLVQKRASHV